MLTKCEKILTEYQIYLWNNFSIWNSAYSFSIFNNPQLNYLLRVSPFQFALIETVLVFYC